MLRFSFCDPLLVTTMTAGASMPPPRYRGRFAPTPSGPLHLGSLLTALASWLQARSQSGSWLLRIDDLDRERCAPGATDEIQRQLEAHALLWDEAPRCQSQHVAAYTDALERLRTSGRVYACACTRATIRAESRHGVDGPVYSGRCRDASLPDAGHALRLRAGAGQLTLDDRWQGRQRRDIERDIGDFAIWRRDGAPGYHLACAVDESAMAITEVIRGSDLLGSTFMQLRVMTLLGLPPPRYGHVPVLTTGDGRKLSKQNHATAISAAEAGKNLWRCATWLGQQPPAELCRASAHTVLDWTLANWRPDRVPASRCLEVEQSA